MIGRWLALAALLALGPGLAHAQDRVLSIGGDISEIVAALGQEARLVGRDTTSTYPPGLSALPDVGYMRALSPEGVLSVGPDLILMAEGAGPPETLDTLRAAGVRLIAIPEGHTPEAVQTKVRLVAEALGVEAEGAALAAEIGRGIAATRAAVARETRPRPRVLFLLGNAGGRLTGAGEGTAAQAMIALAGGVNALEGFSGYKALGDEAIAAAAPDVLLVMERGDASTSEGGHSGAGHSGAGGGPDSYLSHPALAATPAGRARRIVRMPGMFLLGFGPRTAEAIAALHGALYPGGATQ